MIEISATKGYGYIKIEIYHNNKNIDFESIKQEFNDNLIELEDNEQSILKSIKN